MYSSVQINQQEYNHGRGWRGNTYGSNRFVKSKPKPYQLSKE